MCPEVKGMWGGFFAIIICSATSQPSFFSLSLIALLSALSSFLIVTGQLMYVFLETTTYEVLRGRHDGILRSGVMRGILSVCIFLYSGKYLVVRPNDVIKYYSREEREREREREREICVQALSYMFD
mmetsp:Transcript_37737/g.38405  ORF Transcript_37737/g.38405 Transcript_37737/m.38405 type:complete len:127 (+) Transcript_37737:596-976(+)